MHWRRSFFLVKYLTSTTGWIRYSRGRACCSALATKLPWVCNATGDRHVEVGGSSNGVAQVTMARRRRQQEGAGSRRSRRGAPPPSSKATKGSLQHPILPGSVYPIFLVDLEHLCVCATGQPMYL